MRRVIVGAVAPLFVLVLLLAGCQTAPNDLSVGKCIDQLSTSSGTVGGLDTIDCTKPHAAEVYAMFDWSGSESNDQYPGDAAMSNAAETGCKGPFQSYVGSTIDVTTLGVSWLLPTSDSWKQSDRKFICLASGPDDTRLDSSVKGSNK